jgi:hypothetical protein
MLLKDKKDKDMIDPDNAPENFWDPAEESARKSEARNYHRIITEGNISNGDALELIRHRKTAVISSIEFWESRLIGHVHHYYAN